MGRETVLQGLCEARVKNWSKAEFGRRRALEVGSSRLRKKTQKEMENGVSRWQAVSLKTPTSLIPRFPSQNIPLR